MSEPVEITLDTWLRKHALFIRPKSVYKNRPDPFAVCEVEIVSRFYDRVKFVDRKEDIYEKIDDYIVKFPQALLSLESLMRFTDDLGDWVRLPLDKLAVTYFHGRYELGYLRSNYFSLDFGLFPETPSKTDWLMVLLSYSIDGYMGEFKFHVDYTCLNSLFLGLSEWLSGI